MVWWVFMNGRVCSTACCWICVSAPWVYLLVVLSWRFPSVWCQASTDWPPVFAESCWPALSSLYWNHSFFCFLTHVSHFVLSSVFRWFLRSAAAAHHLFLRDVSVFVRPTMRRLTGRLSDLHEMCRGRILIILVTTVPPSGQSYYGQITIIRNKHLCKQHSNLCKKVAQDEVPVWSNNLISRYKNTVQDFGSF